MHKMLTDTPVDITVAVTRHAESLDMVSDCLEHILEQCTETIHLLVLDQAGDSELKALIESMDERDSHIVEYRFIDTNSIAVSRNLGAVHARGKYVLYTDPDCRVMPGWIEAMKVALEKEGAGIAAGKVLPKMESREFFYHKSVLVKELFAYVDRGEYPREVNKAVTSNITGSRASCPLATGLAVQQCCHRGARHLRVLGTLRSSLCSSPTPDQSERLSTTGCPSSVRSSPRLVHKMPGTR